MPPHSKSDIAPLAFLRMMHRMRKTKLVAALLFGAIVVLAVLPGAFFGPGRDGWYDTLRKPPFSPPNWLFAPVWTLLYILIASAGARAWLRGDRIALALWFAQMTLNAIWTPLFFGAHQPLLALVDIVAMLIAIAAFLWRTRFPEFVPYLLWVSFATLLNFEIVRLN